MGQPHVLTNRDRSKGGKQKEVTPENIVKRAMRQLYADLLSSNPNVRLKAIQVTVAYLYRDAKPTEKKGDISNRLLDRIAKLGTPPQDIVDKEDNNTPNSSNVVTSLGDGSGESDIN